jgi:hypothetical protein
MRLLPPDVTSLRASAIIEQTHKGKRIRGRVYVFMQRPASIRFDAMSPADTPLAILTADSHSFSLLDTAEDAFFTGPPSDCNVARLLNIPLPPSAVADILTGTPPLIEADDRHLSYKLKGYHILTLRQGGVEQKVQIVSGKLGTSALRSVVWMGEQVIYDLRFLHRSPVGPKGPALPRSIRFSMPQRSTTVELTYRDIEIDPEIPDAAFHQEPPPGIPVHYVDCEPPHG